MRSMDKLMNMMCTELDEIAEKGQLSAGDVDTVYKLSVSKEKLLRAEELEGKTGYSQDGGWRAEGTYSRNSYNDYGRGYSRGGQHYDRAHYNRGNGRYSMAEGSSMMVHNMQEMMNDPDMSDEDRMALRRAMDVMNR